MIYDSVDRYEVSASISSISLFSMKRFAFGRNWQSFLAVVDDNHIRESMRALCESLAVTRLDGSRVLDIGSGSGLSSLAFLCMGADVTAFDYDDDSVACTTALLTRHAQSANRWRVMAGSALEARFMESLGTFDVVYSWGVLHHTGDQWAALRLASERTRPGGILLIALYNDQGWQSRIWHSVKRIYCSGRVGKTVMGIVFYPLFLSYALAIDISKLEMPGTHVRQYYRNRGMSIFHDWRDWLGGYPFEVASPKSVITALEGNFSLLSQQTTSGWGCNEYVFKRKPLVDMTLQEQASHGD